MKAILPMRPTFAGILKTEDDLRTVLSLPNVVIQPKLGGDRVTMRMDADGLFAWSRKGTPYRFHYHSDNWGRLPVGTILDGEVYRGEFHPFDCLQMAGKCYASLPCIQRVHVAEVVSDAIGHGYKFSTPSFERLRSAMIENQGKGQKMMWEGVVVKDANSPYVPLTNYRHESYTWRKYKWM